MSVDVIKSTSIQNGLITVELIDSFHPNNLASTFGFHSGNTVPKVMRTESYPEAVGRKGAETELASLDLRSDAIAQNIFIVIGYIPIIGLIQTLLVIIAPLFNKEEFLNDEPLAVRISYYTRAIFSGLGIGAIYLIADLPVTLHRFCKA